jgi:hypothetical protein|tara:strand:- start:300 stop:530 length:231 start_codon:yes stop_codon:yes gene_type:complete
MNKLPTGIINIEGEKDLVRDRNSKALLNTNLESLKAYKIKRNANLKIVEYENDINTLKTELVEIKKTLELLVNKIT